MKLNHVLGLTALTLGLSTTACAGLDYFPPERMNCKLDQTNQLICDGFNRQFLVEDAFSVDFPNGKSQVVHFVSGAAYVTPVGEASIFYTYNDNAGKMVKLKTTTSKIQPDLAFSWKQLNSDIYTCTAGYMQCPITIVE